jgi:hypothetical protein
MNYEEDLPSPLGTWNCSKCRRKCINRTVRKPIEVVAVQAEVV